MPLFLVSFWAICVFVLAQSRAKHLERAGFSLSARPVYYGWRAFLITLFLLGLFWGCWRCASHCLLFYQLKHLLAGHFGLDAPLAKLSTVQELAASLAKSPALLKLPIGQLNAALAQRDILLPQSTLAQFFPIISSYVQSAMTYSYVEKIGVGCALLLGLFFGLNPSAFRCNARQQVEKFVFAVLVGASLVTIATTIGIIFSLAFGCFHFFQLVSWKNFFFHTVWDPRFSAAGSSAVGQFGFLPLLWGTFYIAAVAMAFAIPIGLFAAIYMAEYASSAVRSFIKPFLELLAGIPTIVYGFFALITVGPFLHSVSEVLTGGCCVVMAQSVLTAGLVMGIMLIPFVSSLSDDIIRAVPKMLREGSYGLGATQSETIKKVVIPAALPGIVGAILLTAARAIGETMIVVYAAGVAANMSLSPLKAMTTITVKIVSQLTGDSSFTSPQTLVVFALGTTLFFFTLCMNIFALYMVRKYQERYE